MELAQLIKNFVSKKENADILVSLTKLSTEYYSDFINKKYSNKSDVDYTHTLEKINHYLKSHKEFRNVDPRDFSIELMKYLYDHRSKPFK
ncbi:MAG: hypothetical protein BWY36_00541 [Candidatus Diapherotrites archaeon ADurb.Bin253]|jgi:FlaA1/EpsC-like NDP-sugar epimerase|nr:hypothetical protein [Candidatus Pacearchaeota archaeon]OQA67995.1 MAG: hypothetical protein BWY36_00541 [Candidatus Diapherotrites archaeon ADurb.Bin253]HNZ51850.1 hypothetical protein [Candidatus Pacearchaeota archaeon]HOC97075.1 hypothetical protein [Candidatus Pacearchaeota archaeon]HOH04176.1 hypothetical protein [Candidatus Pacearchaeota archaeon]